MKIYTQKEFDAIPRDEVGIKNCPKGDYTEVKDFGVRCRFGAGCRFGAECDFGAECYFGECCYFGAECSFRKWRNLGAECGFGGCCYEDGRIHNGRYVAIDRIGSETRKAYFFRGDEGYFVRAGCWFGTFDEFEKRVHDVHKGTRHERDYINALIFAREMLKEEE